MDVSDALTMFATPSVIMITNEKPTLAIEFRIFLGLLGICILEFQLSFLQNSCWPFSARRHRPSGSPFFVLRRYFVPKIIRKSFFA